MEWKDVTFNNKKVKPKSDFVKVFPNQKVKFIKTPRTLKKTCKHNVDDILDKPWKSKRIVDPLDPVYNFHTACTGEIKGSKVKRCRETAIPSNSLNSSDIFGAQPDTRWRVDRVHKLRHMKQKHSSLCEPKVCSN